MHNHKLCGALTAWAWSKTLPVVASPLAWIDCRSAFWYTPMMTVERIWHPTRKATRKPCTLTCRVSNQNPDRVGWMREGSQGCEEKRD